MGDCTSRPTEDLITKHEKYNSKKNDDFYIQFFNIPYLNSIPTTPIYSADDQDTYTQYSQRLKADIQTMQKLLSSQNETRQYSSQKLLIQIQKGKDLYPQNLCFLKARPFVQVEISPLDIFYRTEIDQPVIPKWFQLFVVKRPLQNAQKIKLTVKYDLSIGGDSVYASTEIEISKLMNQEVLHAWFPLDKSKKKGKPSLLVRLQYMQDSNMISKKNIETAKALLPEAKKALQRIEKIMEDCFSSLPPEGRG